MAIEVRTYAAGRDSAQRVALTECPACGNPLYPGETSDHIATHTPEDFGL